MYLSTMELDTTLGRTEDVDEETGEQTDPICVGEVPLHTLRKLQSSWLATALAKRVFPVPGEKKRLWLFSYELNTAWQ